MMTEFDSKQTFLNELRKALPNATEKFAHALKISGHSVMDGLRTNAHLLSMMADLSVAANDDKTNDDKTGRQRPPGR